ncbi:hypothetical protein [Streptomyces sp. NPDC045251]|uniref:hypothetical protein n=1 Tax=unclassified Streptomyces TaxID=2593676 RepID=UPI0033C88E92
MTEASEPGERSAALCVGTDDVAQLPALLAEQDGLLVGLLTCELPQGLASRV